MALALELEPFSGSSDQNISDWLTRFNVLCTIADIQSEKRHLVLPWFLKSERVINWFIDTDLDHLTWEDLQRTLIRTFGSNQHQFHSQHHQIVYDHYSPTSTVSHELLSSALQNEPLSMWPSGDEEWYVHEMQQQRAIFTKATPTKLEATDNEISNDIKQSQSEPIIMRHPVLFEQQHIQLKNPQQIYHLAAGLQEHLSSSIIQSAIILNNKLDGLLDQDIYPLAYKHNYCVTGTGPYQRTIDVNFAFTYDKFMGGLLDDNQTNLLTHWDWLWPYMVP
ncbi:unnamed protein product [Didymodactylos carnosus]|uniref:Uncharacterized protein n=2 Tax=Didymodactylos carnosus TaxID=1234261 RepID=A0A8S2WIR7_9BILA|nr:unnamed protein product [Didymodactylos carnosus]